MMTTVLGIDFTSAPRKAKPICITIGDFSNEILIVHDVVSIQSLQDFTSYLAKKSEWTGGFDLPFSMPLEFIKKEFDNPKTWEDWVDEIEKQGETNFYQRLENFKSKQPKGKKHLLRQTDRECQAISPMMLYGVPLAKMFYRGALRLHKQKCSLWPMRIVNSNKTAIEVYPSFFAKQIIGNLPYKNDSKSKQTVTQKLNREKLIEYLLSNKFKKNWGFSIEIDSLQLNQCINDATGDTLDSLICCVQAAWASKVITKIKVTEQQKLEGFIMVGPLLKI